MKKKHLFLLRGMQMWRLTTACCLSLFLTGTLAYASDTPEEYRAGVEAVQQNKTVKGTVVDETGEPVIGANVKLQDTTTGTITDLDGRFSLPAPEGGKLEITFIGYMNQVVTVPAAGEIRVVLKEDSKLLDEVIIVGYGTQRVKDLTGAATPVQMADIADLPGASIIDALAGQVIGLSVSQSDGRPGSVGSLQVRQPMTFGAGDGIATFNDPLIVIDDVVQVDEKGNPSMSAFNMLDHSEIESMTVLKDASAAVYGSRASSGVILVKTKRGAAGTPKISYSGKLDFSDAVSHAKTMSAYDTGVFTNRMIRQIAANNGTDNRGFMYSDEELNAMRGLNYNWLDRAWSSAVSHRHSLTVNGGSDRVTYFAGISYQNQDTNLGKIQDYEKWTFRTGGEIKVAAGLKLSASVSGYNTEKTAGMAQAKIGSGPWGNQSRSDDYSQLRHMAKYIPIETEILNSSTNLYEKYYVSPWVGPHSVNGSTDANVQNGFPAWNFFANEAANARRETEENGYNANFSLTYDVPFIKGLSLKGTYSISYANVYTNDIGAYYTLARATNTDEAGSHLIGSGTTWNFISYGDPNGTNITNKPRVIYNKSTSKTEQMNFMMSYNRTFGDHDVSVTGVVERGEGEGHTQQLYYRGPGFSFGGASNTAGTLSTNGEETYLKKYESGSLSYVGRANYKYANRYLLQFLIRSDASTKFAPENYWGTFPTGSLGWVLSEESFFKKSKLAQYVDFLKLRFSLGKTGKDNVDAWKWLQIYNINTTTGLGFGSVGGQPSYGAVISGTANRNVKWDSTIKQNYGLDINLLSGRLSFSTDFYYDKTKDLIMFISDDEEPIYIGAKMPAMNYGKKNAWGWEFSVRWNDKISQSLLPSWGPIKYGIAMDYGISWNKTVLGKDYVFDYPAVVDNESSHTGYKWPDHEWGFKVWKHTSMGDGILRNQDDIDKYWQYLENLAAAAGKEARYLDLTKEQMYPGMLAYQDVAGGKDENNKTIAGPDGIISKDHGQDYVKLANNRRHTINTRLDAQWGNFSWSAQLATSWGGYASVYNDIAQSINNNTLIWSQFSYVNDMFDPEENPMGKYPSMAVSNAYGERSDFWKVSSFRMYVRNMTLSYSLPGEWLKNTGIDKVQFNLTGNNLWDFYNPYPKKFRNMYDDPRTGYPTLRTWTLGLNLTF